MSADTTRRSLILALAAIPAAAALPGAAAALSVGQARELVDRVVGEINGVINSGRSVNAMIADFERIFARYADVPVIARSVLGPAARSASAAELAAYTEAFRGYMARKYGKRFREFAGAQIEVTGAQPVRTYFEVVSVARLRGQSPFEVRWQVSDRSGRDLFFNLIIEGVNMLAVERQEIGAMLDRRRGSLAAMTEDLRRAG
ncbi:MAG: ABC transporter substrate-binding protein [Rhodobacteraceae bacterium]|jgi:phospholipid transport system substrate-binding protein|nr:ABC transporter substrate-binding protein [Paracoccaceae bacterium]